MRIIEIVAIVVFSLLIVAIIVDSILELVLKYMNKRKQKNI